MANNIKGTTRYPWFTVILLYLFGIGMIFFDAQYGILSHMTRREVGSLGKLSGKIAVVFTVLLAAYYLLREVYVRLKRIKVNLTQTQEQAAQKILKLLRQTHWLSGMLAVFFVMAHAYILWYVAGKSNLIQIIPGFSAGGVFVLVMLIGSFILFQPSQLHYRKMHRGLSILAVVLLGVHLVLA